MVSDRKIIRQAQRSAQTSANILFYLDVLAERLGEIAAATNQTISIEIKNPNVALTVKFSQPTNLLIIGSQTENGNLNLDFCKVFNKTVLASAIVPVDTFKNQSKIVYSLLFRDDIFFQSEKQLSKVIDNNTCLSSNVVSKVLAVTVGISRIENLTSPVIFTFKKTEKIHSNERQIVENTCTFWDLRKLR